MSAENNETGGSLADRITKPDEASQPTTTTGTSSNPQLLRMLYNLRDCFFAKEFSIGRMAAGFISWITRYHTVMNCGSYPT